MTTALDQVDKMDRNASAVDDLLDVFNSSHQDSPAGEGFDKDKVKIRCHSKVVCKRLVIQGTVSFIVDAHSPLGRGVKKRTNYRV